MRNATLLFLVKKNDGIISDICLAMKKRGFGAGRYNGMGGKVEGGETIEEAVKRETLEEVGVQVDIVTKCAELAFTFPHKEEWSQRVHVYLADSWSGEIVETEEMRPEWFSVDKIPYDIMWPDDQFWIPKVLEGKFVEANFSFGEGDVILSQDIRVR